MVEVETHLHSLVMECEETQKETTMVDEKKSRKRVKRLGAAMVDEKTSRKRVKRLGAEMDEHWPEDKKDFKTTNATACLVDEFYRDSLPPKGPVELMIISESPVNTRADLSAMKLSLKALKEAGIDSYDGPLSHVNLVHCLTYGESWAIEEKSKAASTQDKMKQVSSGTPAFWKVLATLAGKADLRENGDDPLASKSSIEKAFKDTGLIGGGSADKDTRESRMQTKVEIQKQLKENGIVLIDTSPFAISMSGEREYRINKKTGKKYYTQKYKLSSAQYTAVMRASFEIYCAPFLEDVKPKRVLFLGKKIEKAIGRKRIEEVVSSFGGTLLETMIHPSSVLFFGQNGPANLQKLRAITSASRKRKQVIPQETVSARERSDEVVDTESDVYEPAKFSERSVVRVQGRCWPGMNKPGGVAFVTKVRQDGAEVLYDVKYILGGSESDIKAIFVSEEKPLKKRRTSSAV